MKKPTMSLMEANSSKKICALQRDNFESGDYWLMADEYTVWIHEQPSGKSTMQRLQISKPMFNRLVRQYMKHQKLRKG